MIDFFLNPQKYSSEGLQFGTVWLWSLYSLNYNHDKQTYRQTDRLTQLGTWLAFLPVLWELVMILRTIVNQFLPFTTIVTQ